MKLAGFLVAAVVEVEGAKRCVIAKHEAEPVAVPFGVTEHSGVDVAPCRGIVAFRIPARSAPLIGRLRPFAGLALDPFPHHPAGLFGERGERWRQHQHGTLRRHGTTVAKLCLISRILRSHSGGHRSAHTLRAVASDTSVGKWRGAASGNRWRQPERTWGTP